MTWRRGRRGRGGGNKGGMKRKQEKAKVLQIYILAGPSGQHCRCYGMVDVSVRLVFWCSQCTGEVDI